MEIPVSLINALWGKKNAVWCMDSFRSLGNHDKKVFLGGKAGKN